MHSINVHVGVFLYLLPVLYISHVILGLLIIAQHSVWFEKKTRRITDAVILACLCFKESGTGNLVNQAILRSFDDVTNVADILGDIERYNQIIAPKLYEIATTYVLG